jgi:hypothetical protein
MKVATARYDYSTGGKGCGYAALATLAGMGPDGPAKIKKMARDYLGVRRPLGLSHKEAGQLAVLLKGNLIYKKSPMSNRPTLVQFVERVIEEVKSKDSPISYLVASKKHWVGFRVGLDGSVVWSLPQPRMRITAAYIWKTHAELRNDARRLREHSSFELERAEELHKFWDAKKEMLVPVV